MGTLLSTPLRRALREGLRGLFDLVLPPHCPGCGASGLPELCAPCRTVLVRRQEPVCVRCGEPCPGGVRCGRDHAMLRGIRWARAPYGYAGTGGALVRRLKLDGDFAAGEILIRAMASRAHAMVRSREWRRALLVSVPLHRSRLRARGFDQAQLLATGIGRALGLAAPAGVLERVRSTLPQGDPRVASRRQNVELAFAVHRPRQVAGFRVILVDDVVTSGSTAQACARRLLEAGALEVALVTACQA